MLGSTNDRDQEQSFSMKVEEKDGKFQATATSFPDKVVVSETRRGAITKLNQELQSAHRAGKLKR